MKKVASLFVPGMFVLVAFLAGYPKLGACLLAFYVALFIIIKLGTNISRGIAEKISRQTDALKASGFNSDFTITSFPSVEFDRKSQKIAFVKADGYTVYNFDDIRFYSVSQETVTYKGHVSGNGSISMGGAYSKDTSTICFKIHDIDGTEVHVNVYSGSDFAQSPETARKLVNDSIPFIFSNAIQKICQPQYNLLMIDMKKTISALLAGLLLTSGMCFAGLNEGLAAYKKEDYKTAFRNLMPLANQGNPVVQQKIGWMLRNGEGTKRDDKEAMIWFRKAAEQGDAKAQSSIGNMYDAGEGVQQNYKEAMTWYLKSAAQGNAYSQAAIGMLYFNGNGVPKDLQKAIDWYQKAAKQGDADAQFQLGETLLIMGKNGDPNAFKEAAVWIRKSAEQGNSWAQNRLGNMFENGRGIPQDNNEALVWYGKAAKQGDDLAQENLQRLSKVVAPPKQTEAERYEKNRADACATSNYNCKTDVWGGKY